MAVLLIERAGHLTQTPSGSRRMHIEILPLSLYGTGGKILEKSLPQRTIAEGSPSVDQFVAAWRTCGAGNLAETLTG
jgi:hypothetical protein